MAARDEDQKKAMRGMQASVILTTVYTKRVRGELEFTEARKKRNQEKNQLIGDVHAKWLSDDAFFDLCVVMDE